MMTAHIGDSVVRLDSVRCGGCLAANTRTCALLQAGSYDGVGFWVWVAGCVAWLVLTLLGISLQVCNGRTADVQARLALLVLVLMPVLVLVLL